MACFHPLPAYQTLDGAVVFYERSRHDIVRTLELACGQCYGCRLERSRQWAVRCMHEAQLHDDNAYVTLTYDDHHLPADGGLRYRDFQLFMKRLRKSFPGTRFFVCGEYGERTERPHYHALLFGMKFADQAYWMTSKAGYRLYRSPKLEQLWPLGQSLIGEVTFESAAYCARYILKKVTGDEATGYYSAVDRETGEIVQRAPEFCHMSLRPGIASDWLRLYWRDVEGGSVVVNGHKASNPRYYDKYLKHLLSFDGVQFARHKAARLRSSDNTPERRATREKVAKAKVIPRTFS